MIDEKKLIEELETMIDDVPISYVKDENHDRLNAYLHALSRVISNVKRQPKANEWIPTEERLPDDENEYLVTDGYDMMVAFYRDDAEAWDNANFGWVERNSDDDCPCRLGKVIAWKPLPEPYKKREGDEEWQKTK